MLDGRDLRLTQARGAKAKYRAELHLFYLFPELCKHCSCPGPAACTAHPSYRDLWKQFRAEQAPHEPEMLPRRRIPAALLAWHIWAQGKQEQGLLDHHQVSVCFGPMRLVRTYDRIVYGSAKLVGTVQEKSKRARDSVVMLRDNGEYRAGSPDSCHTQHLAASLILSMTQTSLMSCCTQQSLHQTVLQQPAQQVQWVH